MKTASDSVREFPWRRRTLAFAIAGLLGVILPLSTAAPASAAFQPECNTLASTDHCYAVVRSTVASLGSEFHVVVRAGLAYDVNHMFVVSTGWIEMDSQRNWVEAGYGYGLFSCGPRTTATWYTGEMTSTGYSEICPSSVASPVAGSDHIVRIERLSSPVTSWLVSIDGTLAWLQPNLKAYGDELYAGVEANHWATRLNDSWTYNYIYKSLSGVWPGLWPSTYVSLNGTPSAQGAVIPPYAVFVSSFSGV